MGTLDYKIPDRELELLAQILLPEIKKFFADENMRAEFERWQVQQENGTSKDIE